jgi:adenylate cyclase
MLISGQTLDHLSNPDRYHTRFLDRVIVKGRNEPIAVYQVLDAETEDVQHLKRQTQIPFEQGIEHYQNGVLNDAKFHVEQVLVIDAADNTASLYSDRVHQLIDQGIPENWNDAWVFSEK